MTGYPRCPGSGRGMDPDRAALDGDGRMLVECPWCADPVPVVAPEGWDWRMAEHEGLPVGAEP